MRTATKKLLLAAAIVAVAGSAAQAQRGRSSRQAQSAQSDGKVYIRGGVGYSFGAGKMTVPIVEDGNGIILGYDITMVPSTEGTTTTVTNSAFSLGKGIDLDLGFGYMVNPYVGFELGARYLIGLNNTFEVNYTYKSDGKTTSTGTTTTKVAHSSFALVPALRIVAPVGETVSLYSRLGVSLPLYSKAALEIEGTSKANDEQYSYLRSADVTSYFKLGFSTALGVDIALSRSIALFGEVNMLATSFETKKSTLTKVTSNGDDELAEMDVRNKETEYQHEYTSKSDDKTVDSSPKQEVSTTYPASSVGVTVGLIIKF
jgi:opacity protein-like surface antigen